MAKRTLNASQKRRRNDRDALFGAESFLRMWKSPDEKGGYCCLPRVLPVLMQLARNKKIVGSLDCSSVYLELLTRDWGEGIVQITDPEAHAVRAGYSASRPRSWRERVQALADAGFIEVAAHSARSIGYVLIIHPNNIVESLRAKDGLLEEQHWLAYNEICRDFGMPLPKDPLDPANQDAGPSDDDIPF